MQRIAFFGIFGHSRYTYSGALQESDAMPRSAGSKLESLLELYEVTGNKGNMIHGEAPARIFESDRKNSCYVSVQALVESGWSPERISEELSARFDLVVFSTANAIRPNLDPGCTAKVLDMLHTNFIVVGMGMQNPLPRTTESLHPNLIELLDVCNRKARVFWVRGLETEGWLKSVGFGRAKALGCPSMYVYPQNTLGLLAPDPTKVTSAVTAGYIQGRVPRSSAIIWLFKDFDAHYVMQEEMAVWHMQGLLDSNQDIYNDATGEVNRESLNSLLEAIHDEKMPFTSYRWFQDPNMWRVFASRFDFYLGDRLHGGIVALQAGVPAIMMADDTRVMEIADFFGIPRVSVREAESMPLREIISEKLSPARLDAFKETYFERVRLLEESLMEADISLTTCASKLKSVATPQHHISKIEKKRSAVHFIRRLIRKL